MRDHGKAKPFLKALSFGGRRFEGPGRQELEELDSSSEGSEKEKADCQELWSRNIMSILNHQGTAGFSPCFHLTGFHFGY